MGFYVNPHLMPKEEWLHVNAYYEGDDAELAKKEADFKDTFPVCLVDNGPFTAAGIAFDEIEWEEIVGPPEDNRPKRWFIVHKEYLIGVSEPFKRFIEGKGAGRG